jgi:hypothetical protein
VLTARWCGEGGDRRALTAVGLLGGEVADDGQELLLGLSARRRRRRGHEWWGRGGEERARIVERPSLLLEDSRGTGGWV